MYFPKLSRLPVAFLFSAILVRASGISYTCDPTVAAWDATLSEIFKLDFDVVVPAKSPLATHHDLEVFKSRLDALVTQ